MKYLKPLTLLFLAFTGIALFSFAFNSEGVSVSGAEMAVVSRGSFEVRVNSIGELEAARSYFVTCQIKGARGKIIQIVEDGTWVEEGDTLVKFNPYPFEEEIMTLSTKARGYEVILESEKQSLEWEISQVEREKKLASLSLKTSRLELEKAEKGDGPLQLAQLTQEMEEKKQEYEKHVSLLSELEKLEEKGYSNPAEINLVKAKTAQLQKSYEAASGKLESYRDFVFPSLLEGLRANVAKEEIAYDRTIKGGEFKIAQARMNVARAANDLMSARESLAQARLELERTIIKAPFKGIAVLRETFWDSARRKPRVGDTILQNQSILTLPDISSFIVKASVREADLHKVAVGREADITIDAYPGARYQGKVTAVGALAISDRMERGAAYSPEKFFQVTVSMESEDMRLRPGMTARVSILSGSVEKAVVAPAHTVFHDQGGGHCYKFVDGGYEKTYIKTGRRNEDYVEVLSGLMPGDTVSAVEPAGASR